MLFEKGAVRGCWAVLLMGVVLISPGPHAVGQERYSAGTVPAQALVAGDRQGQVPLATGVFNATQDGAGSATSFNYKFENPRFTVSVIEIEVDPTGSGRLRAKRGEGEDLIERPLGLSASIMSILNDLTAETGFLASNEDYQAKKDFSHLGWVTLTVRRGGHERTVRFNYTTHPGIAEMAAIFRAVADQELELLDLELAVQHQPLELPNLLDALENDLKEGHLADPQQLVKPLSTIAQEDSLPLIARNHASRLIAGIEKGKYKAPFKSQK